MIVSHARHMDIITQLMHGGYTSEHTKSELEID